MMRKIVFVIVVLMFFASGATAENGDASRQSGFAGSAGPVTVRKVSSPVPENQGTGKGSGARGAYQGVQVLPGNLRGYSGAEGPGGPGSDSSGGEGTAYRGTHDNSTMIPVRRQENAGPVVTPRQSAVPSYVQREVPVRPTYQEPSRGRERVQEAGDVQRDKQPTSYYKSGDVTYGSNGAIYYKDGDVVSGSDGTTYNRSGNITYGSDGTVYEKRGDVTYGSDGTVYRQAGDVTYGSNGTIYQKDDKDIRGKDDNNLPFY
ncbi:MAG: hypothetical protein ABIA77_00105 [Candidatus Omnitrophota bacterium]